MIGIVDYGMGNLRSVQKALEQVGAEAAIVRDARGIQTSDKLILPGVGAFADAMANLRERDLAGPVKHFIATGRPFLGICLGLQLLFDYSQEDGEHSGLAILGGRVVRFSPNGHAMKIPHMGWNPLEFVQRGCPLLRGLEPGVAVYFVHSFYAVPANPAVTAAQADYGGPFCAALAVDNIFACQFHPEKSQRVGLKMLENFAAL